MIRVLLIAFTLFLFLANIILVHCMCKGKKEKKWIALCSVTYILWPIIAFKTSTLTFNRSLIINRKITKIEKAADLLSE